MLPLYHQTGDNARNTAAALCRSHGSKEKSCNRDGYRISLLAAGEGFEPSQTESESGVLPLHKPAVFTDEQMLLYQRFFICQVAFRQFPKNFPFGKEYHAGRERGRPIFPFPFYIQMENRRRIGSKKRRKKPRCFHSSSVTAWLCVRMPSISSSRSSMALAP